MIRFIELFLPITKFTEKSAKKQYGKLLIYEQLSTLKKGILHQVRIKSVYFFASTSSNCSTPTLVVNIP